MKQYMVTGGAGFIGSHLVEALVDDGKNVVVVDDFSNGQISNLERVVDKIEVVECDITRPIDHIIQKIDLLQEHKLAGIFHLACHPRSFSLENPFRDLEVNARGTLNILELAKLNAGCKVVFTSNSGIYGEPKYLPIDEKHLDNPTTPYDANKLVAEYYCKIYHAIFGVPTSICRLATVYGEKQRTSPIWKPVVIEFMTKLMNDEAPTICWDGKQTRDFIYVKDVVSGLRKAFDTDTGDDIFILGTDTETSINEMYDVVSSILNKDIEPIKSCKVEGDIRRMRYSHDKASECFRFAPKHSLEDGVKHIANWYGNLA